LGGAQAGGEKAEGMVLQRVGSRCGGGGGKPGREGKGAYVREGKKKKIKGKIQKKKKKKKKKIV